MINEKLIGAALIIGSVVISILYFIWVVLAPIFTGAPIEDLTFGGWQSLGFFPVPPLYWAVIIPLFIVLLVMAVIFGWIGTALVKSPAPPEISSEEIEEELESVEAEEAEEVTTE